MQLFTHTNEDMNIWIFNYHNKAPHGHGVLKQLPGLPYFLDAAFTDLKNNESYFMRRSFSYKFHSLSSIINVRVKLIII